ncbi:MAG: hypothetical protein ABI200_04915 [Gaiellales bacterium]
MASSKTKVVTTLALMDIARQVAQGWSAREQARQQRIGFGEGLRQDARQLARDARERLPSPSDFEWGMPPWHRKPTAADRVRTWAPVAVVAVAATGAVIVAAHVIARGDREFKPDEASSDSRMVGAIRAGSKAIDSGVTKVVEGGTAAAVGTASAVAAGSSAIRTAAVDTAKDAVQEKVVAPAKKKAITWSALGIVGLTVYVVLIATAVQLLIEWLS